MVDKNGLRKAKDFYKKAIEEYERAKAEQSDVLFRDAGEKGWNAVVLATNYFIKKTTGKQPRSNKERREILDEVELKNGKVKRYKLYERFAARAYILHMNCFYDGIYTEDELMRNLKKADLYIKDVEKVVKLKNFDKAVKVCIMCPGFKMCLQIGMPEPSYFQFLF